MQRLEVSGAVRPIYGSLGVKRLISSYQSPNRQVFRKYAQKYWTVCLADWEVRWMQRLIVTRHLKTLLTCAHTFNSTDKLGTHRTTWSIQCNAEYYVTQLDDALQYNRPYYKKCQQNTLLKTLFSLNPLAQELLFLILAHPVYKMWIIQEPNKLALWNKLHFEEKKTESIEHV